MLLLLFFTWRFYSIMPCIYVGSYLPILAFEQQKPGLEYITFIFSDNHSRETKSIRTLLER